MREENILSKVTKTQKNTHILTYKYKLLGKDEAGVREQGVPVERGLVSWELAGQALLGQVEQKEE